MKIFLLYLYLTIVRSSAKQFFFPTSVVFCKRFFHITISLIRITIFINIVQVVLTFKVNDSELKAAQWDALRRWEIEMRRECKQAGLAKISVENVVNSEFPPKGVVIDWK